MKMFNRFARSLAVITCALVFSSAALASAPEASSEAKVMALSFRGAEYEHRWSKDGQNEFTPRGQENLDSWHDMITLNVAESVGNGEQLADLANSVLDRYQGAGKIVRTDSKPETEGHPAEHLIVAVLGNPGFLEAAFARFMLIDGVGVVAVYSHRVYGKAVGQEMSEWLQSNGPQIEVALMAWDKFPTYTALKALPQSK
jgi:hypothetical protein